MVRFGNGKDSEDMKLEDKIADIRLVSQQLALPDFERPEELVSWMGAVQAQDYTMSKWAIGVRIKSGTLRQIDEAIRKGEIVRAHVMRPTWHFVAGKDLRWMQQLTAPRIKKTVDAWVKASGMVIPESMYTKCNDLIGKMLSGHRCLTREEIEQELDRAGMPTADDRVRRYLLRAETEGLVCNGADRAGKPAYTLVDEHIPFSRKLQREEALAELALRYFRSHSPATVKDFVWWSGLTVSEAKQAIGLIQGQLVREISGSQELWCYAFYKERKGKEVLHFLPPYDEYLVSYKDRTPVLLQKYHPKAFNRWGIFYPVVLYNGQIVGNWKKISEKGELQCATSFFESEPEVDAGMIRKAEESYRNFLRMK